MIIGAKFVGPNSFYNQKTKEYWSVLPTLDKDALRLQRALLQFKAPITDAGCYVRSSPNCRVPAAVGGPELQREVDGVPADVGPSGFAGSTSLVYRDLHTLGGRWMKTV